MSRLIDADNLIGLCNIMADKCDGIGESIWNQFAETVRWCPTIDAEPVVKCKDCILDREAQCPMKYATEPDDYCSWGERMEED